jgi:hypothetical protein
MTTPFTRLDAPSRDNAPHRPSGDTVTSLIVRASTWTESVFRGFAKSEMSKTYAQPSPPHVPTRA